MKKYLKKFNEEVSEDLTISDKITTISKIFVVSLKSDKINPHKRKIFFDKELALKYWEEMGKNEYTYWEERVYGV